jgi:hypothetical protein
MFSDNCSATDRFGAGKSAHIPSDDPPYDPDEPRKPPPPVPADEPPPVPEGDPPSDAPPERATAVRPSAWPSTRVLRIE